MLFLNPNDIQLGRGEPIKDTARVLGRMIHGAVIRTFAQNDVVEFAKFSGLPTINALTDDEHPCQILTDLFTLARSSAAIAGRVMTGVGDGVQHTSAFLDFCGRQRLRLRAHRRAKGYRSRQRRITCAGQGQVCSPPRMLRAAAASAPTCCNTDVWVSMGQEAQSAERIQKMTGYQINGGLVKLAKPGALVMHCLPAYRGKEIDEATFEAHAQTIFDQAENRLHVQKAILLDWVTA